MSFLPPSLFFLDLVRRRQGWVRGVPWKVCCFPSPPPPTPQDEILPPSAGSVEFAPPGLLLHVSCLCCVDGNFRNMPPSRRGRERLLRNHPRRLNLQCRVGWGRLAWASPGGPGRGWIRPRNAASPRSSRTGCVPQSPREEARLSPGAPPAQLSPRAPVPALVAGSSGDFHLPC